MDNNEILKAFREVLAGLYFEEEDRVRILDDVGIDKGRVKFSGEAINDWHNILNRAIDEGKLDQLLNAANKEYGQDNPSFQNTYRSYTSFVQSGATFTRLPEERASDQPQSLLDQLLGRVESTRWKLSESNLVPIELRKIAADVDLLNELQSFASTEQRVTFLEAQPATNRKIVDIFHDAKELLILGEPGAGKSFTLWELTRDLVKRARQDKASPIPIYLPLSSWTSKDSFPVWIARTIGDIYRFGDRHSDIAAWLKDDKLILLLDGLDEVSDDYRAECVTALTEFGQAVGWSKIAITCRTDVYQELLMAQTSLGFSDTIILCPLNPTEIDNYLSKIDAQTDLLRDLLQHEPVLQMMVRTPLMLWVMSNISETDVKRLRTLSNNDERKVVLYDAFIRQMFKRHGIDRNIGKSTERPNHAASGVQDLARFWFHRIVAFLLSSFEDEQPYPEVTTKHRMQWLAQRMKATHSSYFFVEKLQPTWLATAAALKLYIFGSRLLAGFLLAVIIAYGLQVTEFIHYPFIGLIGGGLVGMMDYWRLSRLAEGKSAQLNIWQQSFNVLTMTLLISLAMTIFFGILLHDPDPDKFVGTLATSGLKLSFIGFFFGLVFGVRGRNNHLSEDIQNIEKLTFSLDKFTQGFVISGGPFAVFVTLLIWTLVQTGNRGGGTGAWVLDRSRQFFERFGLYQYLEQPWSAVIFGLILGIFVGGTVGGAYLIVSPEVTDDKRSQKLRAILLNNMWVALRLSLFFGAIWGLAFFMVFTNADNEVILRSFRSGVTLGLISFLWYGGYDFIKHYWLRIILYGQGYLPLHKIDDFLDYCESLIFLEKLPGYKFLHNDLLDYFAALNLSDQNIAKTNREKILNATIYVIVIPIIAILLINLMYPQIIFQLQAWRLRDATYRQIVVSSQNRQANARYDPVKIVTGERYKSIKVAPGDKVSVLAGGRLSTGPFVVRINPNGSEASILGLPLDDFFDRIPDFRNGALMFHIIDDKDKPPFVYKPDEVDCKTYSNQTWCLCGSKAEFTSAITGSLEFEINDIEPTKHAGAFYVTVQIEKNRDTK